MRSRDLVVLIAAGTLAACDTPSTQSVKRLAPTEPSGMLLSPCGATQPAPPVSGAVTVSPFIRYNLWTWGTATTITGKQVAASALTASLVTANVPKAVAFDIPSDFCGDVLPGQTVFLSGDGKVAGFISFPIQGPDADNCVGRGVVAQGCFIMRTTAVQVAGSGMVTGQTYIRSDDLFEGFQGNLEVGLQDQQGKKLWLGYVGCWGVNPKSDRSESWSLNAPQEAALQAVRVTIYQYNSGCGNKAAEFFDQFKGMAAGIGKVVIAIVRIPLSQIP